MNVKVKAKVRKGYDMYDCSEKIVLDFTYKADGFKKDNNRITLIWQYTGESYSDYQTRIINELKSLTKEEVIEKVKKSIITSLQYKSATNTKEAEKERILKELNNIKFNFTIKERL
jgi:hypothetical protein